MYTHTHTHTHTITHKETESQLYRNVIESLLLFTDFSIGQIVGIAIGVFALCLLINILPIVICCVCCCSLGCCAAAASKRQLTGDTRRDVEMLHKVAGVAKRKTRI